MGSGNQYTSSEEVCGHTIEALSYQLQSVMKSKRKDSLVDDTSTPWHDGDQVLGQVENSVTMRQSLLYTPTRLTARHTC